MNGTGAERFHALDAVRGGVLILGVFFHATLSFLPGEQMWIVMDASRSVELSVLFFVLHTFRMTVFFVLAGFFGRLLLERVGAGRFVLNRATRIAMPLAMFWPLVLTAFIATLLWAAAQANGGTLPEGPPPPCPPPLCPPPREARALRLHHRAARVLVTRLRGDARRPDPAA